MALIKIEPGYTKTGDNFFMRLSNKASYVPWIGSPVALLAGKIGTVVDAGGWLLRGKVGSAGTALATGAVATATNTMTSATGVGSLINWGSFATTGRNAAGHTRAGVERVTSVVAGVAGIKPQVLQEYGALKQNGFASAELSRRGVANQQQFHQNYMNGDGGVHVNQLGSAGVGR